MPTVDITLPHHAYRVHIERGLLASLGSIVKQVAPHGRAALFHDAAVPRKFVEEAAKSLGHAGYQVLVVGVDAGEDKKNLQTVGQLHGKLAEARLERKSPIIALGGGVIGDTIGFVAATWLRGVPFVQCPTTLLAMVDASVGGKVGVNLPQGKNLVGSFHQPVAVVIDTDTLTTLPLRELRCGLAECVKHGMIRSPEKFAWLDERAETILRSDPAILVELVQWNVAIKAAVVMADEQEMGERAHLNFGHTFAHAIEAVTGYGAAGIYHHGEAVALGMVAATHLAVRAGRCPAEVLPKLVGLLEKVGLPTRAQLPPTPRLMEAMTLDKKVADGKLRLILPEKIGRVVMVSDTPAKLIEEAWEHLRR